MVNKTKEFYYLYGVYLTDGCISHGFYLKKGCKKKDERYQFKIMSKDIEFLEKVKNSFIILYASDATTNIYPRIVKGKIYYTYTLQKRELVKNLEAEFKDINIKELNRQNQLEILRGIFDGDGSVMYYFKRKSKQFLIRITQHKTKGKCYNIVKSLLDNFNLKYKAYETSFNMWHQNAYKFYNLLKPFTIIRKDIIAQKYQPTENKLSDIEKNKIINMRNQGMKFKEISKQTNYSVDMLKYYYYKYSGEINV